MSITTVDDIAAGLAVSQHQPFFKVLTAAKAAGTYISSWLGTGLPTAGSAPVAYTNGSGYTASSSTTGSLAYNNAVTQNYLARMLMAASQPGTLFLYDRLWSCSGMGFANTTYTVTTPGALPARITDNGLGCEIWCEQFAAAGAASGTLTVAYHDSASSAQNGVIAAVQSAPVISQVQLVPLANSLGVKDIVSATNSATWTSGSFGITIAKRIAEITLPAVSVGYTLDWAGCALARIPANACLFWLYLAQNTTATTFQGSVDIIDK